MRTLALSLLSALALSACITAGAQDFEQARSGDYELEKTHASLIWRVSHNGLSMYTARFTDFDAAIEFDADNPVASSVTAAINPLSVETDHPTDEDWDNEIATSDRWLNGEAFPQITFVSTGIEQTGEFTGLITGDLTFLGVTRPVVLEATFNGAGKTIRPPQRNLVGFSATSTIKRSDFGNDTFQGVVGDEVEIIIEAEFVQTR